VDEFNATIEKNAQDVYVRGELTDLFKKIGSSGILALS